MATITGTNNSETINGTADADLIDALSGDDIVYGQGGADEIHGGDWADTLNGGDGDDTLYGEAGKDTLRGDAGNDTLDGGASQDRLIGGTGNDTFVFADATESAPSAQDTITDFAPGQDCIDLTGLLGTTDLAWGGATPTAHGVWYTQASGNTNLYADVTGDTTADLRLQVIGLVNFTTADFLGVVQPVTGPPPVPVSDTAAASEDDVLSVAGNVLANDGGPGLVVSAVRFGATSGVLGGPLAGTYGSLTLNADGSYGYSLSNAAAAVQSLAAGQTAQDVFTYTAHNTDGNVEATLTVDVAGVNDGPTIVPSVSAATGVGVPVSRTATGSDVDAGAVLSYGATSGANGTVSIVASTGAWTYTPAENFTGTDSFTITVNDGLGGSAQQDVDVAVSLITNAAPVRTGIVTTAIGPGTGSDMGTSVLLQADGRILVGGLATTGTGGQDFALARYNPDGTLDTGFGGGDGRVTTAIGPGTNVDLVNSVAVQADGRIVAAGYATTSTGGLDFALVRYNADGTLDTSFGGGDGIVTTAIASGKANDVGHSVTVLADGRILLTGFAQMSSGGVDFALLRYNADGTLDASFGGGDGIVSTAVGPGGSGDVAHSVAVQPDGRILVGGLALTSATGNDFALVRYNADGTLDTGFGSGGRVTTAIGPGTSDDWGYGVTLQPDGRILLAGFARTTAGGRDFAVVRYNSNGSIDTSFGGGDGRVTTAIGPGTSDDRGYGLTLQADGRILIGGYATTSAGGQDFALTRYNADGTLDASFGGGDGRVTTAIGPGTSIDQGAAITVQADGRIVVGGYATTSAGGQDFALARYNADGTPDTGFGGLGLPEVNAGATFSFVLPAGLLIDPEGSALTYSVTQAGGAALPAGISFNAGTRALSGTAPADASDLALQFVGTDAQGASSALDFTLRVNARPTDIQWNAVAPASGTALPAGGAVLATLQAADADAGALSYSLVSGSGFLVSADGVVTRGSGLPTGTTLALVIRVTDGNGATFDETFHVMTGSTANNNPLPVSGDANANLAGDDILYGVSGNDVMYGGVGNDTLFGQDGADTLYGGTGSDVLHGGAGNDAFVFADGFGQDRIVGFTAGGTDDSINLSALTNPDWTTFADVQAHAAQVGADTLIDFGNGNSLTLVGVTAANLTAADFQL